MRATLLLSLSSTLFETKIPEGESSSESVSAGLEGVNVLFAPEKDWRNVAEYSEPINVADSDWTIPVTSSLSSVIRGLLGFSVASPSEKAPYSTSVMEPCSVSSLASTVPTDFDCGWLRFAAGLVQSFFP